MGSRLIDLTGQRFGQWVVTSGPQESRFPSGQRRKVWHCRCDCGSEKQVQESNLRSGKSVSCGCTRYGKRPPQDDLAGRKFGRLTVIHEAERVVCQMRRWACRCECGKERIVIGATLLNGHTKSCGCLTRETTAKRVRTHGLSSTIEFFIWQGIKRRCRFDDKYRQIRMCAGWLKSAPAFIKAIGPRPSSEHSVDRVDNDGHYSCGACSECILMGWSFNVRWATWNQQARNRSSTIHVTYRGETRPLIEWCETLGRSDKAVRLRLNTGWAVAKALETPTQGGRTRPNAPERHLLRIKRRGFMTRCYAKGSQCYGSYGERGITVCVRWRESLDAFIADMGARPNWLYQLDRVDNDGGYWCGKSECPECGPLGRAPNCRWATPKEQAANRRHPKAMVRALPRHLTAES